VNTLRRGLLHAAHFVSDNTRNSLIVAVFAFKVRACCCCCFPPGCGGMCVHGACCSCFSPWLWRYVRTRGVQLLLLLLFSPWLWQYVLARCVLLLLLLIHLSTWGTAAKAQGARCCYCCCCCFPLGYGMGFVGGQFVLDINRGLTAFFRHFLVCE